MTEGMCDLTWPPWHTYSDHLIEMLHQMKADDTFTDVTLVIDTGWTIKAHKVVLGACSPVFKEMLTKSESSIIELKEVGHEEIESILEFIYLGKATLHQERMKEFLDVAQKLQIKELCNDDKIDCKMKDSQSVHSKDMVVDALKFEDFETENIVTNLEYSIPKYEIDKYKKTNITSEECGDEQQPAKDNLTKNIQSILNEVQYSASHCYKKITMKDNDHATLEKSSSLIHEENVCSTGKTYQIRAWWHREKRQKQSMKSCNLCDFKWTIFKKLKDHFHLNHQGKKYFPCYQCEFGTNFRMKFEKHVQTAHHDGAYICILCDKDCKSIVNLNIHIKSEHEDIMHKCQQCDMEFTKRKFLKLHHKRKHEGQKHSCNQCDQKFSVFRNLTLHIRFEHDGVRYNCNQCGKQFNFRKNLSKHIDLKHDGKRQCNYCQEQFLRLDSVRRHIQVQHVGVRFGCDQCDYKATDKRRLRDHIHIKHEGVKKYQCNQCQKQFMRPTSVRRHIKLDHEGLRFNCNQCDYMGGDKRRLRDHINAKHEGMKFKCKQCDYVVSSPDSIRIHIKLHNQGVVFECDKDQCDYKTTNKRFLRKHVKIKH